MKSVSTNSVSTRLASGKLTLFSLEIRRKKAARTWDTRRYYLSCAYDTEQEKKSSRYKPVGLKKRKKEKENEETTGSTIFSSLTKRSPFSVNFSIFFSLFAGVITNHAPTFFFQFEYFYISVNR